MFSYTPEVSSTEPYQELLSHVVDFTSYDGETNLLFTVTGDVEIALVRENTRFSYVPEYRDERQKRLLIEDVPEVPLRIIVYAQNYASASQ